MSLYVIFSTIHLLGLDMGLGTCTVTYVISAYGMFKPSIMPKAVSMFKLLSFIIWAGLFLLVVSGIGLSIVSKDTYGELLSSQFYHLKLILVGLATLNGLFLNLVVTPKFEKAVGLDNFVKTKEYRNAMILGTISGFVSFASWYGAFFLGVYVFRIMG